MELPGERLLTEKEVSELLNVKVPCLRRWRFENRELPFIRVGRLVRYRPTDLKRFIFANTQEPDSESPERRGVPCQ